MAAAAAADFRWCGGDGGRDDTDEGAPDTDEGGPVVATDMSATACAT